jgi:hypothetical protein
MPVTHHRSTARRSGDLGDAGEALARCDARSMTRTRRSARRLIAGRAQRCSVPIVTVEEFLVAYAAEIGAPIPSREEMDALLEVASIAAHGSQRTAAPLACWMGGTSGVSVPELLAAARRVAPGVD